MKMKPLAKRIMAKWLPNENADEDTETEAAARERGGMERPAESDDDREMHEHATDGDEMDGDEHEGHLMLKAIDARDHEAIRKLLRGE